MFNEEDITEDIIRCKLRWCNEPLCSFPYKGSSVDDKYPVRLMVVLLPNNYKWLCPSNPALLAVSSAIDVSIPPQYRVAFYKYSPVITQWTIFVVCAVWSQGYSSEDNSEPINCRFLCCPDVNCVERSIVIWADQHWPTPPPTPPRAFTSLPALACCCHHHNHHRTSLVVRGEKVGFWAECKPRLTAD